MIVSLPSPSAAPMRVIAALVQTTVFVPPPVHAGSGVLITAPASAIVKVTALWVTVIAFRSPAPAVNCSVVLGAAGGTVATS